MRNRLRMSIPRGFVAPLCPAITPVNGYTRQSCGLLFYNPNGLSAAQGGVYYILNTTTVRFSGPVITTNDNLFGANYGNWPVPGPSAGYFEEAGEGRVRVLPVLPRSSGYMQGSLAWSHADMRPGISWRHLADNTYCMGSRRGLTNSINFDGVGVGSGGQAIGDPGSCMVGIEVRPSDRYFRGWSDPGGDPRLSSMGITTLATPIVPVFSTTNDSNGYKGSGVLSALVITTQHAIMIRNAAHGGSVRISVNGVVQTFPGPVNYINLDVNGNADYDPAPGVWYPSSIQYEFFSAPALGGVLVADLTVPTSWGGDTIGR